MKPATIVAIGLGQGGYPPLQRFFECTPLDATAYIVLSHITPENKNVLQAILQKHSPLKIIEAKSNDTVEANVVYVRPEGKWLTVIRNRLIVQQWGPKEETGAIDFFCHSLAKNGQSKIAIVILSGDGADGTGGIRFVSDAKGLIVAQDPATSTNPSMPESAIGTGLVDYILSPEEVPGLLIKWTEHKLMPVPANMDLPGVDSAHNQRLLTQMGLAIKNQRLKKKISQTDLARLAGIQKASMSKLEAGKTNTTILSLKKMAQVLGVDIKELF